MWRNLKFEGTCSDGRSAKRTASQIVIAVTVALLAATVIAPPGMAHSLKDLETELLERERYFEITEYEAPGFTLTDPAGKTVSLSDFRGKVVVLYFVYARCKELCPLQNDFVASIQEQVNITPMREQVQFASVLTDAEDAKETAEIISGFPRRHGFDTSNWIGLYRGSLEPLAAVELAETYGLRFDILDDGDQIHPVVTFLIDPQGTVRGRYHGLYFNPTNLISHINALMHDGHGANSTVQAPEPSLWQRVRSWF